MTAPTNHPIIYDLMRSTTISQVNEIVSNNQDFINDHPFLFRCVSNARKRINRLRRMKLQCTELIYMN